MKDQLSQQYEDRIGVEAHENPYALPTMDTQRYQQLLAEDGLTAQQCEELLKVLWEIMSRFVEIGFGVDSVHNVFSAMARNHLAGRRNSETISFDARALEDTAQEPLEEED